MYGQYPTRALGGPSDAEVSRSMDPDRVGGSVGATLAKWFGVQPSDLGAVFPNLTQFPASDLGFMA